LLNISILYHKYRVLSIVLALAVACAALASCNDDNGCFGCARITPTEFSNGVVSADLNRLHSHPQFDAAGGSMYSARSFIGLVLGQCPLLARGPSSTHFVFLPSSLLTAADA
jgi:hypothetical protein